MHHYSSVTGQNNYVANHDTGIKNVYIRLELTLALQHDFRMDAILATAALQMYKLNPGSPSSSIFTASTSTQASSISTTLSTIPVQTK